MASKWNENFRIEAEIRGVEKGTLAKLLRKHYDSEQALHTLEDVDMQALDIEIEQRRILDAWKNSINTELQAATKDREQVEEPEQLKRPQVHELQPDVGQQEAMTDLNALECVSETQRVHDEFDIEHCMRDLNIADQFRTEIDAHIQINGIRGIDEVLQNILDEYRRCSINTAVIGRRGTGKSSLINCLRNLRSIDEGAAKTGPREFTKEICPYPYPDCDKFILWDLPGVGTKNFPRSSYLETIQFSKYDAYIIVCTDGVTEDDIWIAQEVQAAEKKCYFVRTKIDDDWRNAPDDGIDDEEVFLKGIRDDIQMNLESSHLPTDNIFLVSNRLYYQTKWDFPKLVNVLTKHTSQKNQRTMAMSMMSCTKEVIDLKRDKLHERIQTVAALAASMKDETVYQTVVLTEIKRYTTCLGTTDIDLEKWKVDIDNLHPKLRAIWQTLDETLKILKAKAKSMQFLCGAFNFFFTFFELKNPFKTRLEAIQAQQGRVVSRAKEESFSLKRDVAEDVMKKALEKCHELAIGILDVRM